MCICVGVYNLHIYVDYTEDFGLRKLNYLSTVTVVASRITILVLVGTQG